jgi:hypothetical protein
MRQHLLQNGEIAFRRSFAVSPTSARRAARQNSPTACENGGIIDFKLFQAEIKKAFKADIPLKQRNDWESLLREEGEKVRCLTAEIEQAEREIDAIVYKLFNLTPDEIALLESSLAGQY